MQTEIAEVALARELVGFIWEAMQSPFRLHESAIRQNSDGEGSPSKNGEPMLSLFGSDYREPGYENNGSSNEVKF